MVSFEAIFIYSRISLRTFVFSLLAWASIAAAALFKIDSFASCVVSTAKSASMIRPFAIFVILDELNKLLILC